MLNRAFFLAAALALTTVTASAQVVSIGIMRSGSTGQVGTAIAKVVSDATQYNMRAVPQAGTAGMIAEVNGGQMEFGLGGVVELTFARQGKEMFEGQPSPNIRLVGKVTTFTVGLIVREDSEVKSVAGLKGKRVPTDVVSAPSVELTMKAVLASGGLTRDDVTPVQTTSLVTMWEGFEQGQFDTAMAGIGSGRTKEIAVNVGGIRFLEVDPSPESIARMQIVFPGARAVLIEPAPALDGFAEPTHVLGYSYFVFASDSTPDEVVTKTLEALYASEAEIKGQAAVLADFSKDGLYENVENLEYHPAALAFFKAKGLL